MALSAHLSSHPKTPSLSYRSGCHGISLLPACRLVLILIFSSLNVSGEEVRPISRSSAKLFKTKYKKSLASSLFVQTFYSLSVCHAADWLAALWSSMCGKYITYIFSSLFQLFDIFLLDDFTFNVEKYIPFSSFLCIFYFKKTFACKISQLELKSSNLTIKTEVALAKDFIYLFIFLRVAYFSSYWTKLSYYWVTNLITKGQLKLPTAALRSSSALPQQTTAAA